MTTAALSCNASSKRASNWRERERAKALLLLDSGVFAEDVAAQLGLNVRTVRITHVHWLQEGMAALSDLPRSGAPKKLAFEHIERLVQWAQHEPLTAAALLARHLDSGGSSVHVNTNQAASGEIELAYLDEAGFSAVHPNRSAWTPRGKCHLIEARRSKRLNVLAALLCSGQVLSAKYWQSTTAEVFVGFLSLLSLSHYTQLPNALQ